MTRVYFTTRRRSSDFGTGAINEIIHAIEAEMTCHARKRQDARDVLIYGGSELTSVGETEIGTDCLNSNWNIIHAAMDVANPGDDLDHSLSGFRCFITDGFTQIYVLRGGRLWKRDARTPAILVFPDSRIVAKISSTGRIVLRDAVGEFHEFGYHLATKAVRKRMASKPNNAPVIRRIGDTLIVHDIKTMLVAIQGA